jgi:hypothetical protein
MALDLQLSLGIASVEENCLDNITVFRGIVHPVTDRSGVPMNTQSLIPTQDNSEEPPQL